MHVILLTDQRLFSGPARDPALERLWCHLYDHGALAAFHILSYDLTPGDDFLMPGCQAVRGSYGALSVLPHAEALVETLAVAIGAEGPVLVCLASDRLAPLAVGLSRQCPDMTLCMLDRLGAQDSNWPVFRDLFAEVIDWREGDAAEVADRLVAMADMAARPRPVAGLLSGASYHPLTSFYLGHLVCWGRQANLGLRLSHAGAPIEYNVSLEQVEATEQLTILAVKAVLPRGVAPTAVRLELFDEEDGASLYDGPLALAPAQENCGFLSIEPDGDRDIDVIGWTRSSVEGAAKATSVRTAGGSLATVVRQTMPAEVPVAIDCGETQRLFHDLPRVLENARGDDLATFRDCHKGRAAWLIGNGPSVRHEDLEQLSGALSFGFNRLHLAYGDMAFRPSYLVCADSQMIEDFGEEIARASEAPVFFAHATRPDVPAPFHWLRQVTCFPSVFSHDAGHHVTAGGSSVYVAMQLAYFMGVRRFYFYGADFRFAFTQNQGTQDRERSAQGEGNHFIKDYRGGRPWSPPELRNITTSFMMADLLLRAEGGFVKNVTRGGLLEIFDRMDFEAAFTVEQRGMS